MNSPPDGIEPLPMGGGLPGEKRKNPAPGPAGSRFVIITTIRSPMDSGGRGRLSEE